LSEFAVRAELSLPLFEVRGEVDHLSVGRLEAETFVDSAGIAVPISPHGRMGPGGRSAVVARDGNLARIFKIVGLILHPAFRLFASLPGLATPGAA
jgi:hypothetical protein